MPSYKFQALNWRDEDVLSDNNGVAGKYIIWGYGRMSDGSSVSLKVSKFQPYFYVKRPLNNRDISIDLQKMLKNLLIDKDELPEVIGTDVWGYKGDRKEVFYRLDFPTKKAKTIASKVLSKKQQFKGLIYETSSQIEPILRFFHCQEIEPAQWIYLKNVKHHPNIKTTCDWKFHVEYTNVKPANEGSALAPFKIMAFDIECTSTHGDFPLPTKTFYKQAYKLYDYYLWLCRNVEGKEVHPRLEEKLKEYFWDITFHKQPYTADYINNMLSRLTDDAINVFQDRIHYKTVVRDRIAYILASDKDDDDEEDEDDEDDEDIDISEYETYANKCMKCQSFEEREEYLRSIGLPKKTKYVENVLKQKVLRNEKVKTFDEYFQKTFSNIMIAGDPVIQIGATFHWLGDEHVSKRKLISYGGCDHIDGAEEPIVVHSEADIIKAFAQLVRDEDPDILTGHNIFGFDNWYLGKRAEQLGILNDLCQTTRHQGKIGTFDTKKLSSSALGDNILYYISMEGRIMFDLMKTARDTMRLDSFKLDNIAWNNFIGSIIERDENCWVRIDGNVDALGIGDYISCHEDDTKHKIEDIEDGKWYRLDHQVPDNAKSWGLVKDDVSPNEIFKAWSSDDTHRAKVGKYCIKDCELCNQLVMKLGVIPNNMGMANVCLVPLEYLFWRGQGIKITSVVSYNTRKMGFFIPQIDKSKIPPGKYEGAFVKEPVPGIYTQPIGVGDFSSLYPSCMISENISHDTYVAYPNKLKANQQVITVWIDNNTPCYFLDPNSPGGRMGVIPQTLRRLLDARKVLKKTPYHKNVHTNDGQVIEGLIEDKGDGTVCIKHGETGEKHTVSNNAIQSIEDRYDKFQKSVLKGLEAAYKVVCNSLYGQVGSKTSDLHWRELASSTTASGRHLIENGIRFMTDRWNLKTVYGDTDSFFVCVNGSENYSREQMHELAEKACDDFTNNCKKPHKLELEKLFHPLIIPSKKRYYGILYEDDMSKGVEKTMGLQSKKRDTPDILKRIMNGMMKIIAQDMDVKKAVSYVRNELEKVCHKDVKFEEFIMSKTLKGFYKQPDSIAHKVLNDHISERTPGSEYQVNDRIAYVISYPDKPQTAPLKDKIEHPDYVREHNMSIDYAYYIKNVLMNPLSQIIALAPHNVDGYTDYINQNGTPETQEKVQKIIQELLFHPYIEYLRPPKKVKSGKKQTKLTTSFVSQ